MRDKRTTNNEQQLKIELLSQWKLEAEFRNFLKINGFFPESFPDFLSQNRMFGKRIQLLVHYLCGSNSLSS